MFLRAKAPLLTGLAEFVNLVRGDGYLVVWNHVISNRGLVAGKKDMSFRRRVQNAKGTRERSKEEEREGEVERFTNAPLKLPLLRNDALQPLLSIPLYDDDDVYDAMLNPSSSTSDLHK